MKKCRSLVVSMFVTLLVVACSHGPRVVESVPGESGSIAVKRDNEEARQKAIVMMQKNCGSRTYKIIKEGEAVIGHSSNGGIGYGHGIGWGSSSTTDKTEWRIEYKCVASSK